MTSTNELRRSDPNSPHSPGVAAAMPLARVVVAAVLIIFGTVGVGSATTLAEAALRSFVVVLGALTAVWEPRRRLGGAAFLYVCLLACFQLGLVWAVPLIGQRSALVGGGANGWIWDPEILPTVHLVCIAIASVCVGVMLGRVVGKRHRWTSNHATAARRAAFGGALALALGWALLAAFLFGAGGIALIGGGYGEFFEASADARFAYAALLLGFGCALCVAAGGGWLRGGWISWGLFAALMLSVGARGTALYPLVAMVFAQASSRRLSARSIGIAVAVLSMLISAVRVGRNEGLSGTRAALADANPMQTLAELGYSLLPVLRSRGWIDDGETPLYGSSIFVLPIRFFESLVGIPHPEPTSDLRYFNILIENRLGPVGGSPVAEGYMNGGTLGVVCVMAAIGVAIGIVDTLPATRWYTAIGTVVLLPLFMNVRNFFSALPAYWALGVFLLAAGHLLAFRKNQHDAEAGSAAGPEFDR